MVTHLLKPRQVLFLTVPSTCSSKDRVLWLRGQLGEGAPRPARSAR